jgi:UMF1 family MFS transporter
VLQHISAASLGLGNGAGMLCLILWAIFALGRNAFGVPADFNIERVVGPVMAIWFMLFVIPFFVFMPDGSPAGGTWRKAAADLFRDGTGQVRLVGTSRRFVAHITGLFREFPELMKYLLARIAFADALTTLLSLGGVYTTGVLQWSGLEIALYAVFGSLCAALGSFFGGVLDTRLGSRNAIAFELTLIIICVIMQLSITKDSMLFGLIPSGQPVWSGIPLGANTPPAFQSLSDVSYLFFIAVISGSIAACLTSSRYMLVAMAPKHRVAEFFGLYMLSATVTVWMGPLLNGVVTTVTRSQRWGMATVMILLVTGYVLFLTLKVERKPEGAPAAP